MKKTKKTTRYAKPILLSPVQDFISLKAAIEAGADAIYFGIKGLNMRAGAKNFELKDLKEITKICHKNKVKAYLALNVIVYDSELMQVDNILKRAKQAKIDAIICWDMAVLKKARQLKLETHLSTQASVSNYESARFYSKLGIKQIILARELDIIQIKKIIKKIKDNKLKLNIETFIHGAMCVSVSGRCFLSQQLFNKSANRGECLQPCRRKYLIKDPEENHELFLGEDYVMSPEDLCTIDIIDQLIEARIDCFKIEGRNRSPEYVKVTTECYRYAIDSYLEGKLTKELKQQLKDKLATVYNRGFSTGFYLGKPIDRWSHAYGSKATTKKEYIGYIKNFYNKINVAEIKVESGSLSKGDNLMIQGPTTGVKESILDEMQIERKEATRAKKGDNIGIKLNFKARMNDKVYKIIKVK